MAISHHEPNPTTPTAGTRIQVLLDFTAQNSLHFDVVQRNTCLFTCSLTLAMRPMSLDYVAAAVSQVILMTESSLLCNCELLNGWRFDAKKEERVESHPLGNDEFELFRRVLNLKMREKSDATLTVPCISTAEPQALPRAEAYT